MMSAPDILGETTRDHRDLDLAVLQPQLAGTQVRAHLGYRPTAKDRKDMARLRERLGVDLPVPYSSSRA
jgi:hypothetical protein